jgi:hypothetical protein
MGNHLLWLNLVTILLNDNIFCESQGIGVKNLDSISFHYFLDLCRRSPQHLVPMHMLVLLPKPKGTHKGYPYKLNSVGVPLVGTLDLR